MIPTNANILQCMKFTFENILMEKIEGDYEKSQGRTMLNLFDYAKNLSTQEGELLWEEKQDLTVLLGKIQSYFKSLAETEENTRLLARIATPIAAPENGYPSIGYLNDAVITLKTQVYDALGILVKFSVEQKDDTKYKAIRKSIRDYLVSGLNRDDALMQASFTTKRR